MRVEAPSTARSQLDRLYHDHADAPWKPAPVSAIFTDISTPSARGLQPRGPTARGRWRVSVDLR